MASSIPEQYRAVDPFASYNSNTVNQLTELRSRAENVLDNPCGLDVVSDTTSPTTAVVVQPGYAYKDDVMITPDGAVVARRGELSNTDHELSEEEISVLMDMEPEIIIIGSGKSGALQVGHEAREACASQGIQLMVEKTPDVIKKFNYLAKDNRQRVAALFHITC